MDKLPEPEFQRDKNWPRLLHGVEQHIEKAEKNRLTHFALFSSLSIFRYWREVTFYKKNYPIFFMLVVPGFLFTSWELAKFINYDTYAVAALKNNEEERRYLEEAKHIVREYKKKSIRIPDELIK
jgi:hypothetical protein